MGRMKAAAVELMEQLAGQQDDDLYACAYAQGESWVTLQPVARAITAHYHTLLVDDVEYNAMADELVIESIELQEKSCQR